jgi:hypothetical protein
MNVEISGDGPNQHILKIKPQGMMPHAENRQKTQ